VNTIQHGTRSCYTKNHCRRPECIAANTAYVAKQRARRALGDVSDLRTVHADTTDATPAREHINALKRAGFTLRDITLAASDVSYETVKKIARGQAVRVERGTAESILAIEVEDE
jgi:hypothetical protein